MEPTANRCCLGLDLVLVLGLLIYFSASDKPLDACLVVTTITFAADTINFFIPPSCLKDPIALGVNFIKTITAIWLGIEGFPRCPLCPEDMTRNMAVASTMLVIIASCVAGFWTIAKRQPICNTSNIEERSTETA